MDMFNLTMLHNISWWDTKLNAERTAQRPKRNTKTNTNLIDAVIWVICTFSRIGKLVFEYTWWRIHVAPQRL